MRGMKKFVLSVITIVLIAVLMIVGIIGGRLVIEADAAQDYPLKIWKQNENGRYHTLNVVDSETGVNYVVVSGELYSKSVGIAICPRYNADGSLYVSK